MSKSAATIKSVVATKVGKGFRYTATMSDGSEQVIRAKATTLYPMAHLHSSNVNTGKAAGLPSTVSFGKKPANADTLVKSYKIVDRTAEPAKAAPAKAAPAKKASAKAKPAPKAAPAPKAKKVGTYAEMQSNRFTESKVEHPVRTMWDLCDSMVNAKRKDVIAAAVAKGISFYTARTQYQLWLAAYRNSK
jgi:hypothetical protein